MARRGRRNRLASTGAPIRAGAVGTTSVEKSRICSVGPSCRNRASPTTCLNRQPENVGAEAEIIAQGRPGRAARSPPTWLDAAPTSSSGGLASEYMARPNLLRGAAARLVRPEEGPPVPPFHCRGGCRRLASQQPLRPGPIASSEALRHRAALPLRPSPGTPPNNPWLEAGRETGQGLGDRPFSVL